MVGIAFNNCYAYLFQVDTLIAAVSNGVDNMVRNFEVCTKGTACWDACVPNFHTNANLCSRIYFHAHASHAGNFTIHVARVLE